MRRRTFEHRKELSFRELLKRASERVASLPPMTADERQEQAANFAYGNLASTTHHLPTRAAFYTTCIAHWGWSEERFKAWADKKQWFDR